jgi:type IV pilus biogenesis protein CpaD/CtpE
MKTKTILIVIAVAVLASCRSAPVFNVDEAPIVIGTNKPVTVDDVKTAILRAGGKLGWQMTETQPGLVNARIALRSHTATADVRYSAKTYSIIYRNSTDLDRKDGQIHKNYNGWVENLNREIRTELLKI